MEVTNEEREEQGAKEGKKPEIDRSVPATPSSGGALFFDQVGQ
jgi:hypothetical protein